MNPIHNYHNFPHRNSRFLSKPISLEEHPSSKPFPGIINALSSRAIGAHALGYLKRGAQAVVSVRSRIQQYTYFLSCLKPEWIEQHFLGIFKHQLSKMDKKYVFHEVVQTLRNHCHTEDDLKFIKQFTPASHPLPADILTNLDAKDSFFKNLAQLDEPYQARLLSSCMSSKDHSQAAFLKFLHQYSSLDFQKQTLYNCPQNPNTPLIQERILACEKPAELEFVVLHQFSCLNALLDNRSLFKADVDSDRTIKEFLRLHNQYFFINFDNQDNALNQQFLKKALKHYPDLVFAGIEKIGLYINYLDSSMGECLFAPCTKSQRPLSSIFPCLKSLIVIVEPEEELYASDQEEEDQALHQSVFKEISKLSQLQDLEIQVECLSKDLLDALSRLPSLKSLKLVFDDFSMDDFSDMQPLLGIKHLGLCLDNRDEESGNAVDSNTFMKCLKLFPNLSSLVLNDNSISSLYLSGISRRENPNPNLEELSLLIFRDNLPLAFLSKILGLTSLTLNGNIRALKDLPSLPDLKNLIFDIDNEPSVNKAVLDCYPNLEKLKLRGRLIDLDLLQRQSLPLIRVLDLSQCGLELVEMNLIEKLSDFDCLRTILLSPEVDTSRWPLALQDKLQVILP
jgi:hypothetical protein